MHVMTVPFGSDLYYQAKKLRQDILRAPLGMILSEEELSWDSAQTHLVAVDANNHLLGTAIIKTISPDRIKVRQMAVSEDTQGRGVGRQIMLFAEKSAREQGCQAIELHARVAVSDFYRKLGYKTEGVEFIEVGIPHIKMTKTL